MSERHQGNRRATRVLTIVVAVVVLALAAVSAASAQRHVSSGQWIVFTANPPGITVEQIFRIQPSGAGLKQLTKGAYPSIAPAFSPNGKRIAYARLGAGIFTMNLDGSGVHRLTTNGRDSWPAWSPDGKKIAFVRPNANGWRPYVMSASGAGERELRQAPSAGRPSWTARGLVIPTGGDLAKIDPQSGHVQKLFGALIDASVGMDATAVAPDLSTITFVGARPPVPGDKDCGEGIACPRYALYSQNLHTHKAPRILTRDTGPATYSPDGKNLAFVARNRLVFWVLANGTSKSIKTGRFSPTTSGPPAWQPR